jgi:general secretion pathway protein A
MYESFFGLREPAFSLTPDPRFLWPSETHQEGFAALYYGITRRKGFLLLTGDVGTGKTTLLRAVLSEIPQEIEVALLMNTADLDGIDLFKLIAAELRLEGQFATRADYLIALNNLLTRLDRGLNTVLVIDEAQNLSAEMLEEVRLLSNLETPTKKLLQIMLTGQPAARRARVGRARSAAAAHRARTPHQRLRPEEILPYLRHRIEVAGARMDDIFAPGCDRSSTRSPPAARAS